MLRAGIKKLSKLAAAFARLDPTRHPKMLVVCEDTSVSPLVAAFLQDEGLAQDEGMTIDSGKKAELSKKTGCRCASGCSAWTAMPVRA